ncbi:oxygenase MpaB family protein [Flammeovirga kamogawensis]|uniref:DUF2236 domain-containing protein n=1 Tax=Flammeovirga kamogawensis TaxID=373891 RepID=A0ABX8GWI9_9BACT|nr:oxygenase MpaB family protein [Flammeovirga kamogawensis]MBB6461116.1 hypothetical protein [Flammeovirga kamogawensis]QWG07682.1 DUF2236 domain-containing protein [Flammeovirga kamogawensis]TRX69491.1 DUF2236 domain-containing protein [Flammeovirga kamogawensis]
MNNVDMDLRLQKDPLADETIRLIIEEEGIDRVNQILVELISSKEIPEIKNISLQNYFMESQKFIHDLDEDLIKQGQDFFEKHGPGLSAMLLCKSLPATYACANGAEVVYRTGQFMASKNQGLAPFTKRLMETAQFVINVMSEGGLNKSSKGIISAQKVRLMHAAIRYYLQKNHKKGHHHHVWDTEKLGEPINQEDMLGTLLSFSVFPIQGLEKLGVTVSPQEKKAYLYTWTVVGKILGVHPDIIPATFEEGEILGQKILDEQKAPSEAGHKLTEACVEFLKAVIPGEEFDGFPEAFMRFLLGDDLADIVGLDKHSSTKSTLVIKAVCKVFQIADHQKDESKLICAISERFNMLILQGVLNYFYKGQSVEFTIPPSLRKKWKIDNQPTWKEIISSPSLFNFRLSLQKHN